MSSTNDSTNGLVGIAEIRRAVADYMSSEGCSCCRNTSAHERHAETLAQLLRVPKYDDLSGWNFPAFQSEQRSR